MYWKIGDYQHPDGEVNVVGLHVQPRMTRRGLRRTNFVTIVIRGEVVTQAATPALQQAALAARIAEIQTAYLFNDQSCGLYHSDNTVTLHRLDQYDPNNLTGNKFALSWIDSPGGEYASRRSFQVTCTAEFIAADSQVLEYHEELRFVGNCGPRKEVVEYYNDDPEVVTVRTKTTQYIVQSGHSLGLQGYILPALPLWNDSGTIIELQDRRVIQAIGPETLGRAPINFGYRWQYHFVSTTNRNASAPGGI
jgi:hypothetical protein